MRTFVEWIDVSTLDDPRSCFDNSGLGIFGATVGAGIAPGASTANACRTALHLTA
jgi:hypothetical protein